MSDSNDFSQLLPHIADAFQRYYNQGHAAVAAEMMKRDRANGDMSMETVMLVLLNLEAYQFFMAVLPALNDKVIQGHLLAIIDEAVVRTQEEQDGDEPS